MTYYPDQSEYEYRSSNRSGRNVGWLGRDFPFTTGEVPPRFLLKLAELCFTHRANQTRGLHTCEFCPPGDSQPAVRWRSQAMCLGSAEVHVPASDGTVYKAPDLVYHYVAEHGYLPPEEFVRAVMGECEQAAGADPARRGIAHP
jgi:hypothetical protein